MDTQPHLGRRLREERKRRGHSLAAVAAATQISTSFLSLVEQGKSDITISRLLRVLRFLGLKLNEVLPDAVSTDSVVLRRGEHRHLYSPAEGIDMFLLAPDTNRAMMPLLGVFGPSGRLAENAAHEGEEFLYVVEGAIELEFEGREHIVLRRGDSAYYRGEMPHTYRNSGRGRARLLGVVTPPSF